MKMNEQDLARVSGGSSSFEYVFYKSQRIWGPNQSRVICVNTDVSTNDPEYAVPVTVTPFSPMNSPQDITMTVRLLKDYLDRYGLYEG